MEQIQVSIEARYYVKTKLACHIVGTRTFVVPVEAASTGKLRIGSLLVHGVTFDLLSGKFFGTCDACVINGRDSETDKEWVHFLLAVGEMSGEGFSFEKKFVMPLLDNRELKMAMEFRKTEVEHQ